MILPFWNMIWQFLTKPNLVLPHNLAVGLLSVYLVDLKFYVHIKICIVSICSSFILPFVGLF